MATSSVVRGSSLDLGSPDPTAAAASIGSEMALLEQMADSSSKHRDGLWAPPDGFIDYPASSVRLPAYTADGPGSSVVVGDNLADGLGDSALPGASTGRLPAYPDRILACSAVLGGDLSKAPPSSVLGPAHPARARGSTASLPANTARGRGSTALAEDPGTPPFSSWVTPLEPRLTPLSSRVTPRSPRLISLAARALTPPISAGEIGHCDS